MFSNSILAVTVYSVITVYLVVNMLNKSEKAVITPIYRSQKSTQVAEKSSLAGSNRINLTFQIVRPLEVSTDRFFGWADS